MIEKTLNKDTRLEDLFTNARLSDNKSSHLRGILERISQELEWHYVHPNYVVELELFVANKYIAFNGGVSEEYPLMNAFEEEAEYEKWYSQNTLECLQRNYQQGNMTPMIKDRVNALSHQLTQVLNSPYFLPLKEEIRYDCIGRDKNPAIKPFIVLPDGEEYALFEYEP